MAKSLQNKLNLDFMKAWIQAMAWNLHPHKVNIRKPVDICKDCWITSLACPCGLWVTKFKLKPCNMQCMMHFRKFPKWQFHIPNEHYLDTLTSGLIEKRRPWCKFTIDLLSYVQHILLHPIHRVKHTLILRVKTAGCTVKP